MTFHFVSTSQMTRAERRLFTFATFPDGWHYGEGKRISDLVFKQSKWVVETLLRASFTRNNAFPNVDGDVLVTAYRGKHYIGVNIAPDGILSFIHEIGDDEIISKNDCQQDEIKELILGVAKQIWPSSASLATGIGSPTGTGSLTTFSKTLVTVVGSPSSISPVRSLQAA